MAKYEKYKLTNSLGFEKIPEEWNLKKVKYLFNIGRGRVISQEELMDDSLYPVFSSQTQNNGCLGYINTFDFDCEQLTWTTDGANAGTVFIRSGKHNCTNVCGTLQPITKKSNLKFSHYALQYATQFHKRPDTNGAKIMNNEMAEISFALPSEQEQFKIVEYLNYETAQIDTLIAKQEKLIELLKEKRQAVISHAVTKGLNPDVTMKDSGVEWLGQVPEHWDVITLKYLVTAPIIDGPHVSPIKRDDGIPFISAEAISSGRIDFEKKWGFISNEDQKLFSKRYVPKYGDLLIVKLGATTGSVAMVETDEEFNIWVPLATVRVSQKHLNSKFMYYLFQSLQIKDAIQQSWTFGTQQTLGLGTISNFRIPLPTLDESHQIVKYLDKKLSRFSEIITQSEKSLNLLKERRTALISSAVTGKLDVRNWQHPNKNNDAKTELGA